MYRAHIHTFAKGDVDKWKNTPVLQLFFDRMAHDIGFNAHLEPGMWYGIRRNLLLYPVCIIVIFIHVCVVKLTEKYCWQEGKGIIAVHKNLGTAISEAYPNISFTKSDFCMCATFNRQWEFKFLLYCQLPRISGGITFNFSNNFSIVLHTI